MNQRDLIDGRTAQRQELRTTKSATLFFITTILAIGHSLVATR